MESGDDFSTPDAGNTYMIGDLVYEVPAAQKTDTLSFQADTTSDSETVWGISL